MIPYFKHIDEKDWHQEVEKPDGLVAVLFWSHACSACAAARDSHAQLGKDYEGKITFVDIDAGVQTFQFDRHKPTEHPGLPSLMFFYKGIKLGEIKGHAVPSHFQSELNKILDTYALSTRTPRLFRN